MKTMSKVSLLILSLLLISCDTTGVEPDEKVIDGNISLSMGVPASLNQASKSSQTASVSRVRLLLEEIKLKTDVG
ncbi:MAG: hypothetical protein K9N29_05545, partial [Candidatus Marinimicrobia bacterium]|nr:hypothetical protein [Candidatus Neomarinimicrobiota bacterium]